MNNPRPDKPLSCLLVEDDPQSMEYMVGILQAHAHSLACYQAKTLKEAEALYAAHDPRLLILDINLPDGDSFELLANITEQQEAPIPFKVIFTTAFANYAVEAFKISALDYLLKPFTPHELTTAVDKALIDLDMEQYRQQLDAFFHNQQQEDPQHKKIVLKSVDNIHVVKIPEISQAVADNNYTVFHLIDGRTITVSLPLKSYEQKLSPCGFMRVHQSHLVNLSHIKTFQRKNNMLILENGIAIPVSLNKRPLLLDYLNTL